MEEKKAFIVTEVGMNHMGDAAYAEAYVNDLIQSRPDGVTFQIREKDYYDKQKPGESPLLDFEFYRGACRRLQLAGIKFGVGLCDIDKVRYFSEINTDFYKVLSKDIGNAELITAIAASGKPIYVSTGMSDEGEIATFLESSHKFKLQTSLIHTQLSYVDEDINLRAISRLRDRFQIPVAFGSHSTDINVLYAALAFDPAALFFYVKGSRSIQHKDEDHAVTLEMTHEIIHNIRRLETMVGDGIKKKMKNRIAVQTI